MRIRKKYILLVVYLFSTVVQVNSCSSYSQNKESMLTTTAKSKPKDNETLACSMEIEKNWCYNGGSCVSVKVNNEYYYHCICKEPFTGHRCILTSNKIKANNKVPSRKQTEDQSFKEFCEEPYKSNFCNNGGTCVVIRFHNIPHYYCECLDSYSGDRCEYKGYEGTYQGGLVIKSNPRNRRSILKKLN